MHELANFGIIPRDESEKFLYLIAYFLLPDHPNYTKLYKFSTVVP